MNRNIKNGAMSRKKEAFASGGDLHFAAFFFTMFLYFADWTFH